MHGSKLMVVMVSVVLMVMSMGVTQSASATRDGTVRAAAPNPAYYVVAKTTNKCGHSEYLRRGNGTSWGYRKIATKHNLRKIAVWKAVIHKTCGVQDANGSTTYIYRRLIKRMSCTSAGCSEIARVWIRAVQQRRGNKGAISAYCEHRDKCPNWVNTLVLVENPARVGMRSGAPSTTSYMMMV